MSQHKAEVTVPARAALTALPKGHEFPVVRFAVTGDDLRRYLDAVEDRNAVYEQVGLASPLAVAARALAALLEQIDLAGGTLHVGQEIESLGGIEIGAKLSMRGRIAQRSVRAGGVISVIEFVLTPEGKDETVLTGRSTVMVQGAGA